MLTITLVAFESLAISTVMPVVSADLGGLSLYGWVFSGFFLGNLLGIVTAGQLVDDRGAALPFAAGLALFSGGLLIGGLAPSMGVLVAGRVAQGIGAGAIPAVAYASVGRSYPASLRPRVFAVFSSAWVVPGLVGPAASGAIADAWGWRAVFLALLPFVALAAAIALPALAAAMPNGADPREPGGRELRLQSLVLTAAVTAVLVAASGAPLALGVALVVVGLPVAARAFLRLVPAGTLRLAPGLPAAVLVRGILTFTFFGTDAYVSLTFQDVRHQPTWVAGAALTGATLTWATAAWVQERWVHRVGPRRLVILGFAFITAGEIGMLGALGPLPVALAVPVWSLAGFGIGLAYSSLSVIVLGLAEPGHEGASSSSLQLTDVLGVALGTGLGGVFVTLGDSRGWLPRSALELAFSVTVAVAGLGALAARRLPVNLRW